jgi:hypothetical protein
MLTLHNLVNPIVDNEIGLASAYLLQKKIEFSTTNKQIRCA